MEIYQRYLDATERASQVHHRIHSKINEPGSERFEDAAAFRLEKLKAAVSSLQETSTTVGNLPPAPSTFRAKGSALLVQIVRRALFWYTPQIRKFQQIAADLASEQVHALEAMQRDIRTLHKQVDDLRAILTGIEEDRSFRNEHAAGESRIDSTQGALRCRSDESL